MKKYYYQHEQVYFTSKYYNYFLFLSYAWRISYPKGKTIRHIGQLCSLPPSPPSPPPPPVTLSILSLFSSFFAAFSFISFLFTWLDDIHFLSDPASSWSTPLEPESFPDGAPSSKLWRDVGCLSETPGLDAVLPCRHSIWGEDGCPSDVCAAGTSCWKESSRRRSGDAEAGSGRGATSALRPHHSSSPCGAAGLWQKQDNGSVPTTSGCRSFLIINIFQRQHWVITVMFITIYNLYTVNIYVCIYSYIYSYIYIYIHINTYKIQSD